MRPFASFTVSVTVYVPVAAHVFFAVAAIFVSDRPSPQLHVYETIAALAVLVLALNAHWCGVSRPAQLHVKFATGFEEVGGGGGGGGATTVIERVAVAVAPFESVAFSVIVCAPTESVVVLNDVPDPICPLMELVHTSEAPDSAPSSASLPDPVNVTLAPCVKLAPLAGAVIVAVGAVFVAATVARKPT